MKFAESDIYTVFQNADVITKLSGPCDKQVLKSVQVKCNLEGLNFARTPLSITHVPEISFSSKAIHLSIKMAYSLY